MGYELRSLSSEKRCKKCVKDGDNTIDCTYCQVAYFTFHEFDWRPLLLLAQFYGWLPFGMTNHVENKINGYCSNDWSIVENGDASNLADALEKAVNDLQESSMVIQQVNNLTSREKLLKNFSGIEMRNMIMKFIDFCRLDGFIIS